MIKKIKKLITAPFHVHGIHERIAELEHTFAAHDRQSEIAALLQGRIMAQILKSETSDEIRDHEFRVFSQYGDDGIIQFLIRRLGITVEAFVEFGVENYREANTRFLLLNNNWKGLIIDGSEKNMAEVKREELYWRHELTAVAAFVTAENINQLLSANGFTGETGILHIDIDGNDYWVWKAINVIDPTIVIMEYNAVFGENFWTVPYDATFYRTKKHHSNLYFGASLTALNQLAGEKGYIFAGCNSNGNNAYFVKKEKLNGLAVPSVSHGFVNSKFRESRDESGNLTYATGQRRLELLRGMKVFNTQTQRLETI
jgi:hypothetical protein